jgi:AAA+ ATPase superfamily predicted ATPase
MAFVDRAFELAWLEEGFNGRPQFRILYGRRRTGKSRLLDEFVAGKRHVTYQAVEGSTQDHLADLTAAIVAVEPDPLLSAAPLANWDAALMYLTRMAAAGPIVVVLDEFQYAAQADPTLASRIQRWWSREVRDAPLYLIVCGSYVRFFVENVLTGPAYGRNTGSLQLQPLGYRHAAGFFPHWSAEDRIRAFAVTGGMPQYLEQFDPGKPLRWNIVNRVLTRGAVLYQEAELLMREELREPRMYMSILRAVSEGTTESGKLQSRVQSRGSISSYLATLRDLDLLSFRQPVIGATVRRGVWALNDPYLRFWFRFVHPYRRELEHSADPQRFYDLVVEPAFDQFVSKPAFEDICVEYVRAAAGRLEPRMERVGPWWGPVPDPRPENPRHQAEAELEVVGVAGKRVLLAGEAKWTNAAVGPREVRRLREVVRHVPGVRGPVKLLLFGRRFDQRLANEDVELITADQVFE